MKNRNLKYQLKKIAQDMDDRSAPMPLVLGSLAPTASYLGYLPTELSLNAEAIGPKYNSELKSKLLQAAKDSNVEIRSGRNYMPAYASSSDRKLIERAFSTPEGIVALKEIPEAKRSSLLAAMSGNLDKDLITINPATTEHILAHELGHAKKPYPFMKWMGKPSMRMIAEKVPHVGLGAAALSGLMYAASGTDEGRQRAKNVAQIGALGSAAMAAPTLLEELRANIHGAEILRKSGLPWKEVLKRSGQLLKAQAYYPAQYLSVSLGVLLGGLLMRGNKKNVEENK